jgi:hypothetical protein
MNDNDTDFQALWRDQPTEGFRMSPTEIRERLAKMNDRVKTRTRGGYLASAFLTVAMLSMLTLADNVLMRAGIVLTIVGVLYLGWNVHQHRGLLQGGDGDVPSTAHLRRELVRQRDFHRGWNFWSRLVLLTPGPLMLFAGFAMSQPHLAWIIRLEAISCVAFLIAAIPLNHHLSRKYQRQIDALDRLQEAS